MIYVVCAILVLALVFTAAWAIFATVYMWKFARTIMGVEDQVEESLDSLDRIYAKISHVLAIPVMSDDPHTREVIAGIKEARQAVLKVGQRIAVIKEVGDGDRNEE